MILSLMMSSDFHIVLSIFDSSVSLHFFFVWFQPPTCGTMYNIFNFMLSKSSVLYKYFNRAWAVQNLKLSIIFIDFIISTLINIVIAISLANQIIIGSFNKRWPVHVKNVCLLIVQNTTRAKSYDYLTSVLFCVNHVKNYKVRKRNWQLTMRSVLTAVLMTVLCVLFRLLPLWWRHWRMFFSFMFLDRFVLFLLLRLQFTHLRSVEGYTRCTLYALWYVSSKLSIWHCLTLLIVSWRFIFVIVLLFKRLMIIIMLLHNI